MFFLIASSTLRLVSNVLLRMSVITFRLVEVLVSHQIIVETIGSANEEVIRAYVQSQLKEHKKKKNIPQQLDLF